MKLFDLHCDTAYQLWIRGLTYSKNNLHINRVTNCAFLKVIQTFAFWRNSLLPGDAWQNFISCYYYFKKQILPQHLFPILAVEDLSIIGDDLHKIKYLKQLGFTIFGLFWSYENQFGCAHNSSYDTGLTNLGRAVVIECMKENLILDVSHASSKSTEEILNFASKYHHPVIASHSNFLDCCSHKRNLLKDHALEIGKLGGLIGLSFVPEHIGGFEETHVLKQLDFALKIGLEKTVCIGSDFDGTDHLPRGISSQIDIHHLNTFLKKSGLDPQKRRNLFWENGFQFCKRNDMLGQKMI